MPNSIKVIESPLTQGADEEIAYMLTTTPWGSTPTNVTVTAYDIKDSNLDVSSTVLTGSPSVTGDVITLPVLSGLTPSKRYRVEIKFMANGQVFEPYLIVNAE